MKTYLLVLLFAIIFCKNLRFLDTEAQTQDNVKKMSNFDKLNSGINKVCDMWQTLCSTFGNKKWDYVKSYMKQDGYEKLALDTLYLSGRRARLSAWDDVWNIRFDEMDVTDPEDVQNLHDTIEFARDSDSSVWNLSTNGFNDKGQYRLLTLLVNVREEDSQFDYVIFDMKIDFKIAPMLVFRCKGGSHIGGAITYSNDEIEEVDETLGTERANAMVEFFKLFSLKLVASLAGVQLKMPFEK